MKLIYQHMLSFLFIVLVSVSIIGYTEIDYVKNQAYAQNFRKMDHYALAIGKLAQNKEQAAGKPNLNRSFLAQLQFILGHDDVNFKIFNGQNQLIYPQEPDKVELPPGIFQTLRRGQEIHIRNNNEQRFYMNKKSVAYTGVLVPWFSHGKLGGIIWLGSTVKNVERPVLFAKRNLLNALLVTLVVGLFLSYILAYYSTTKIKRLSKATEKVAAGDFNVHIAHKNHDEIDHLASNFNYMVRKLKSANQEVKRQERRRDQFLADAAHEMRTPLTTINGTLEGLQYDAIPEESKPESIALMQRETKRLIRLVNENLDYEKIRNNEIKLRKSNFDSCPVLRDIREQLEQNAAKKKDALLLALPPKLMTYADHDRFTQIMVNLIQNAIQFTKAGKIVISGRRRQHAAQFKVQDNGIGMSADQMKFIFERFFKADPSRARRGTGESGLGLSIVSSLIKQHGGKIEVASQLKVGSTFTVTFYDQGYEQKENKKSN